MPLRRITKFCSATCRSTGLPCKNPTAYEMRVCRSHGARPQSTVLRNEDHPMFKHGRYTNKTKAAYRAAIAELEKLEEHGFRAGFMTGSRTRGPKLTATMKKANI